MKDPSDTDVLKRVAPGLAWLPRVFREQLTPAAAWVGIGAVFIGAGALYHRSEQIPALRDDITNLQDQGKALQSIREQLVIMNTKLDMNTEELNRQREWRERIEDVAEHRVIRRQRPK